MTEGVETRFALLGEDHVAYQVVGDGPVDLVLDLAAIGNVELSWEVATCARVFERLASFSRLILFDHRGFGLSDPLGFPQVASLEEWAKDIVAVLDDVGSSRAAVVGNGTSGMTAMLFAAAYPNRTSALVLDGCCARYTRAPDYPIGRPRDQVERGLANFVRFPGRAHEECSNKMRRTRGGTTPSSPSSSAGMAAQWRPRPFSRLWPR